MGSLMASKKFRSVLTGAILDIVVIIISGIAAKMGMEIDSGVVIAALVAISSQFGVQVAGQAYADGKTGGLTSSNSKFVGEVYKEKNKDDSMPFYTTEDFKRAAVEAGEELVKKLAKEGRLAANSVLEPTTAEKGQCGECGPDVRPGL